MSAKPGPIRQFVDVRRNEVEPAALFFSFWFLVIVGFQVLKQLKKGLFVDALGADVELYAKLANIAIAALAVVGFTALYNRLGSRRLLATLSVFFAACLLGFALVLGDDAPAASLNWAFYLFGDAWSTVWVTAFWAYLNEMTTTDQSKRLYGLIGGGGVIGGLLGGLVVWQLVEPFGSRVLLVGCAAVALIIGAIAWRAEMLAARPGSPIGRESEAARLKTAGTEGKAGRNERVHAAVEGARLVLGSRYLLAIVGIVFLYEVVSQVLDYQYAKEAELAIEGARATQAFFGQVMTIIGVISVVTQLFLVSFVIRRFGITAALLVLPVALLVSSGVYVVVPVLWTAALLSISDNALSYSMNQTARETLFMPTTPDEKYKARAFANMFVQRTGKGAAILMVLGLTAIPLRFLSVLALAVIVLWAALAFYAGRRFDRATAGPESPPVR